MIVASSPGAGSSSFHNQVPCSLVTAGPEIAANGPQHLGLRDNQVSGDLESCNEGTQLNLLVGAHRKSVPKGNQKVRAENTTGSNPFDKKKRSKIECLKVARR